MDREGLRPVDDAKKNGCRNSSVQALIDEPPGLTLAQNICEKSPHRLTCRIFATAGFRPASAIVSNSNECPFGPTFPLPSSVSATSAAIRSGPSTTRLKHSAAIASLVSAMPAMIASSLAK
jgi:hypothetical protein